MLPVYILLILGVEVNRRLCCSSATTSAVSGTSARSEAISGTMGTTEALSGSPSVVSSIFGTMGTTESISCTRYNQGCD